MQSLHIIKILFVFDNSDKAQPVIYELDKSKLAFESKLVVNRSEFIEQSTYFIPDLIISDCQQNNFNCFDILKDIADQQIPASLIVFTDSINENQAIECVNLGAADYVLKEYSRRISIAVKKAYDIILLNQDRENIIKKLVYNEESFSTFFTKSSVPIATLNSSYKFILANQAFCDMLGYDLEELKKMTFIDITHPDSKAVDFENVNNLIKGIISIYRTEKKYITKDKRIVWGDAKINVQRDRDGNFKQFLAMVNNVSFRKEAEFSLLEKTNELESFFNQAIDLFCISDKNGFFKKINKSWETTLGYQINELQNHKFVDFVHADDMESTLEIIEKLKNNESVINFTNRYLSKNQIYHIMEWRFVPHDNLIYMAARDITEFMQMEKQLRQSQKMEAIGTLSGGIAHDFNNILSAIIGYVDLCKLDTEHNAKIFHFLDQATKASFRARDLVNQILSFSRHDLQEKRPVKLIPIVKETIKFLRASLSANILIESKIETDTDTILGNAIQIQQVILNLATNAAYAVKDTGGKITIKLRDFNSDEYQNNPQDCEYLLLEVQDDGCGIREDDVVKIFDPYFTTKPRGEGTGLGLSVVSGIIRSHDGIIKVYSELNKGTVFYVYLPKIRVIENHQEILQSVEMFDGTENILLVDDESMIVDVLKRILTRHGYQVSAFLYPEEALAEFKFKPEFFNLIITDMSMPKINGFQFARQIKSLNKTVPIILCSGFLKTIDIEQANSIGIDVLIKKPIETADLLKNIRKVLDEITEPV